MTYIYNAKLKKRELIVTYQGKIKALGFSWPLALIFLDFLAKQLEIMFLSFKDDKTASHVLGNVLLKEIDKIEKLNFGKSFTEAAIIVIKLIQADPEIFKQAVNINNIEQEELEKYIKISKDIAFCHLFELISKISKRLMASKTPFLHRHSPSPSNVNKETMEDIEEEKEGEVLVSESNFTINKKNEI